MDYFSVNGYRLQVYHLEWQARFQSGELAHDYFSAAERTSRATRDYHESGTQAQLCSRMTSKRRSFPGRRGQQESLLMKTEVEHHTPSLKIRAPRQPGCTRS